MKKLFLLFLILLPLLVSAQTRPDWTQIKNGADAMQYGAKGDGTTDDSAAIQAAVNAGGVILRGRNFRIASTIIVPSNRFVKIEAATIFADTGTSAPLFQVATSAARISFSQEGGAIVGTCSAVIKAHGTSDDPTVAGAYVTYLRISGLQVECVAGDMPKLFDFRSVKTLYVSDVFSSGPTTAVYAQGKSVEHMFNNCFFFGNGADDSYGFYYNTTAAQTPEGLHVSNSIIDAFQHAFSIRAMYVSTITNCYIASKHTSGGYAFYINPDNGAGARTFQMQIGNCIITAPIIFNTGFNAYQATIHDCLIEPANAGRNPVNITLSPGASNVNIRDSVFNDAATDSIALSVHGSGYLNEFKNLTIGSSYLAAVSSTGGPPPAGLEATYQDIDYLGTSASAFYFESPIRWKNCTGSNAVNYSQVTIPLTAGNYAVAASIASSAFNIGARQRGWFDVDINYSNASTTTQLLYLAVPAGVQIASGSGWDSGYIPLAPGAGAVSKSIPFYAFSTATEPFVLTNNLGNTLALGYQSHIRIRLED
jgi:hypothetical protein